MFGFMSIIYEYLDFCIWSRPAPSIFLCSPTPHSDFSSRVKYYKMGFLSAALPPRSFVHSLARLLFLLGPLFFVFLAVFLVLVNPVLVIHATLRVARAVRP